MKKIIFLMFVFIIPLNAMASIQGTLDRMFMSNSTPPGSLNTSDRTGYGLGGFSARSPVKPIQLAAFDPPRVSAGCGGLDLYGGSFSFINADQFTALVRQIMANAIGLMFQAALKSINPMIADLVNYFQDVVNGLNKMSSNTCAIAHQLTDQGFNAGKIASSFQESWSQFSATVGTSTDNLKEKYATPAEQTNNAKTGEDDPKMPSLGNLTWRALQRSKAFDKLNFLDTGTATDNFRSEVLIGLLGTQINRSATAPDNGPIKSGEWDASLHVLELVNEELSLSNMQYRPCVAGDGSGRPSQQQYGNLGCPALAATTIQLPFSGTYPYILNMLYGDPAAATPGDIILNSITYNATNLHPDSLLMKLTQGTTSTFTTSQRSFLYSFPTSISQIVVDAQSNKDSLSQIFSMLAKYAAYDMALRIAQAAQSAGRTAWDGLEIPKINTVLASMKEINAGVGVLLSERNKLSTNLLTASTMAKNVRISNPNTIAAKVGGSN